MLLYAGKRPPTDNPIKDIIGAGVSGAEYALDQYALDPILKDIKDIKDVIGTGVSGVKYILGPELKNGKDVIKDIIDKVLWGK
jgi:hypothetical protein